MWREESLRCLSALLEVSVECVVAVGVVCLLTLVLRRRPIAGYALAVCLVGYFAAGIALYVDGLRWERGSRSLWLEAFCGRWFWPCAFLSVGFGLGWILRRCRSRRAFVTAFLLPGVFGAVSGLFYGVLDSGFEGMSFYTNWYSMFLLPAAPGDRIANIVFLDGWDWQGGEVQHYTIEIAIFSGLVWLTASAVIALPTYFISRRQGGPSVLPFYFAPSTRATATSDQGGT